MTPRDVRAPDGAVAWLEGSGRAPSRWLYDDVEADHLRRDGYRVLAVEDVEGIRAVPAVVGTVDAAEVMALAARLDALDLRAHREWYERVWAISRAADHYRFARFGGAGLATARADDGETVEATLARDRGVVGLATGSGAWGHEVRREVQRPADVEAIEAVT